ncbi:hypothetical protein ACB092_11G085800 [Castanea dentata]
MKKAELVFIPSLGIAPRYRDHRLYITVLIMKQSFDPKVAAYTESLNLNASSYAEHIQFIDLPEYVLNQETNPMIFLSLYIESQKPHVKEAVTNLKQSRSSSNSLQLAGFVIDLFCATMVDVANEFGVPTYVFFTASAGFLSLVLHLQTLRDEHNQDTSELFKDSDDKLVVPSFVNPLPARAIMLSKDGASLILDCARRWKETKGIIVNTFMELESYAILSISNAKNTPPSDDSHVGSSGSDDQRIDDIMKWLDNQPPLSVVFLCFGSMGSLDDNQVREIAQALDRGGFRFLWSLRRPPPKGKIALPTNYENLEEVLPEGFLDRTAGIGKVIGWAPQVAIFSHPAIGGFVSHCGWNSILESLWFGVPIAAWPLYAEQQLNAFEMVKELNLAVEIILDSRRDFMIDNQINVASKDVENGIRQLMESDNLIRKRVKEMTERSRMALMDGGSSHFSLGQLIDDVIDKMP